MRKFIHPVTICVSFASALGATLALGSPARTETKFECEAKSGERALIVSANDLLSLTVWNTGDVFPGKADYHLFPDLAPFLEKTPGVLRSTSHVATMSSYYPALDESGESYTTDHLINYVIVQIDHTGEDFRKVKWDVKHFGVSGSFEIVCDKKGLWTSPHQAVL